MQSREKIEQRRRFTKAEKLHMLAKSNNRCCHCGEILDIHSMSVEHAVPISHAGMNDERNLVALCKTCNPVKDDKVLTNAIPAYYKYLNLEPLLKLLEYVDEYCKTYGYFEWNNFTQEDDTLITPKNMPTAMQQIEYKEDIKNTPKLILHKVRYCDLDDLVCFYTTKLKGIPKKEIIQTLHECYLIGAIYCIRTPYNEIVGAFSVCISVTGTSAFEISNIAYSDKYYKAMEMSLNWVLNNIQDNVKSKVYGICFLSTKADKYSIIDFGNLICGKLEEITYRLPEKERSYGTRVWLGYFSKSNSRKCVSGKVLSVMLKSFEKELNTYRKDRKEFLVRMLSYEKQKQFKFVL